MSFPNTAETRYTPSLCPYSPHRTLQRAHHHHTPTHHHALTHTIAHTITTPPCTPTHLSSDFSENFHFCSPLLATNPITLVPLATTATPPFLPARVAWTPPTRHVWCRGTGERCRGGGRDVGTSYLRWPERRSQALSSSPCRDTVSNARRKVGPH